MWKKEKDEFEAWKREKKQAEEKASGKATQATEQSSESVNTDEKEQPGDNVTRTEDPATAKDSGPAEDEVKSAEENMGTEHKGNKPNPQVDGADVPGDDDQNERMPPEDHDFRNFRGRPPPRRFYREIPRFYRDSRSEDKSCPKEDNAQEEIFAPDENSKSLNSNAGELGTNIISSRGERI